MRNLFNIDRSKGIEKTSVGRHSSRAIIIKNGKLALVHSKVYDYYKFPGGGINRGEDPKTAVIRETREETGLIVDTDSISEYGFVHRVTPDELGIADLFVQDNYYYFCDVSENRVETSLDDYERDEGFTLEWVRPEIALTVNRSCKRREVDPDMIARDSKVIELLVNEGYFD